MRSGVVNGFEARTNGRRLDPEVDVTFQLLQVVRKEERASGTEEENSRMLLKAPIRLRLQWLRAPARR